MDGLTIGGDDDCQDQRDNGADPHGLQGGHGPRQCQRQQDFVGRVRDRRQRIRGENGQSDTFGEQLVAHRVRSHRASDKHTLRVGQQVLHGV